MGYSHVCFRILWRILSRHTILYTEMMVDQSLLAKKQASCLHSLLVFPTMQHPIIAQLGGNELHSLTEASLEIARMGYDGVNINMGCPSNKVAKKGCFGAALMITKEFPEVMRLLIRNVPFVKFSIKCRIGVDEHASYEFLRDFIQSMAEVGVKEFVVHARIALLDLDTKRNRSIPKLQYDTVYRLKQEFPSLIFCINGGITTAEQIKQHLEIMDGVMIGRAAFIDPCLVSSFDRILNYNVNLTRRKVIDLYRQEVAALPQLGLLPESIKTGPLLGLFFNISHSAVWKQALSSKLPFEKKLEIAIAKMHQHPAMDEPI